MYERFYDLRERPFSLSPDPDYLYPSRVHIEALSYLRYGLEGYAGFIVLTGEIGSGKTTLLQTVLRGLDHQTSVSRVVNTLLQPRELLEAVLLDFGLEARAEYGKPHLVRELARFLVGQRGAGRMALLVIDEAQNLSLPTLEEVRMLSNLETEKSKLLQIVLVGQPSLRDTLRRPELEQLQQRVGVSYHLGALDAADTAAYIRHRVRRASMGAPVEFPPPVSNLVHHHSGGIPRTINLIADAILLFAYGDGQRGLSVDLARAAIDELEATGVIARLPDLPGPALETARTASPAEGSAPPQLLPAPKVTVAPAPPPQPMWQRPPDPPPAKRAREAPLVPPPAATRPAQPSHVSHVETDLLLRKPENAVGSPAALRRPERTTIGRASRPDERSPASTITAIGATALAGVAVIAIAMAGVGSFPEGPRDAFEVLDSSAPTRSPLPSQALSVPPTWGAVPGSARPVAAAGAELAARGLANQPRTDPPTVPRSRRASLEPQSARRPAPPTRDLRTERLPPASQRPSPASRSTAAGLVSPQPPSGSVLSERGAVTTPAVAPITVPPGAQTSTVAPPSAAPGAVVAAAAQPPSPAAAPGTASVVTAPAVTPPPVTASRSTPLTAPPSIPSAAAATAKPATGTGVADDGSVQAVLNQYRRAYSSLDVRATRAVWPSVNDRALTRAFESLESQEIDFSSCQISVSGNQAHASCGGRARYVPRVGNQSVRSEPRQWTFDLRRADDRWTISSVQTR